MAKLRILTAHGDTVLEWMIEKVREGDPEALAAVREAERIFREATDRGATAFEVKAGQPAVRVTRFDPKTEEVVIVPRIVGG